LRIIDQELTCKCGIRVSNPDNCPLKKIETAGSIRLPKYSSDNARGVHARLYVAPDAAAITTKTFSFTLKGPGLRLKLFLVSGTLTSHAGRAKASQSPA